MRCLLAAGLALFASASPARTRDAIILGALIESFASMPGLSARFREEKHLSLLQTPLVSEGVLYFAPPDRLARHVEKPAPSTLLLRGDELVIGSGGESTSIDLASQPALRAFVDAFRSVLAGDLPRLRTLYDVAFQNDEKTGWQIRLTPRDERLAGVIRVIEVAGVGVEVRLMRVVQVDGDSTTTRFHDIDRDRHFSAAELDALFRIEP